MREREEAYRVLEAALSIASSGVDEAEVALRGGTLGYVRFSDNEVRPAGSLSLEKLTVRVRLGGRWARVSTSDLTVQGIGAAAQHARAELGRLPESEQVIGLPPPQNYPSIDAFDPRTAALTPMELVAWAGRAFTAAHRGGLGASGRITVARGGIDAEGSLFAYALANTRGLLAYHPSTRATAEVELRRGRRSGRAGAASWSACTLDPRAVVDEALRALGHAEASACLPPGRYPAVLDVPAVAALAELIGAHAGAGALSTGESFLSAHRGQSVVDERLSLIDDFAHPGHRAAPFDCDGVARQRVVILERGVAANPVVSWPVAQRLDLAATGHGVERPEERRAEAAEHLVLAGGEGSTEDLVRGTRAGLLIRGFGDLQVVDGARLRVVGRTAGGCFAIEGGEPSLPLPELRFDVSVLDLLSRVGRIGTQVVGERAVVPPLEVDAFPVYSTG